MNVPADNFLPAGSASVVLIGYGNTLRSDDGAGPAVLAHLAPSFESNPHCLCLSVHQLTPELAVELSLAGRVIFVDASAQVPEGKARIRRISDQAPGGGVSGNSSQSSLFHTCSPEGLLALTRSAFGRAPQAWAVAIGVADLSVGEGLSAAVARCTRRLARHLAPHVRRWSASTSNPSLKGVYVYA